MGVGDQCLTVEHCRECMHPLDPHAVFMWPPASTPGGIMLCPVPGCQCCQSWAAPGCEVPEPPDDQTIARWRRRIQQPPS